MRALGGQLTHLIFYPTKTRHMRPPLTQTVRLILCLLLASPGAFAQTKDTSLRKLYAHVGGGAATRQGYSGGLGVQAVWKNSWTTTLSYHYVGMNPKNLPKDYKPGTFFAIPDGYPESVLRVYSLSAGKYVAAGGKAWLTTEAGCRTFRAKSSPSSASRPTVADGFTHLQTTAARPKRFRVLVYC